MTISRVDGPKRSSRCWPGGDTKTTPSLTRPGARSSPAAGPRGLAPRTPATPAPRPLSRWAAHSTTSRSPSTHHRAARLAQPGRERASRARRPGRAADGAVVGVADGDAAVGQHPTPSGCCSSASAGRAVAVAEVEQAGADGGPDLPVGGTSAARCSASANQSRSAPSAQPARLREVRASARRRAGPRPWCPRAPEPGRRVERPQLVGPGHRDDDLAVVRRRRPRETTPHPRAGRPRGRPAATDGPSRRRWRPRRSRGRPRRAWLAVSATSTRRRQHAQPLRLGEARLPPSTSPRSPVPIAAARSRRRREPHNARGARCRRRAASPSGSEQAPCRGRALAGRGGRRRRTGLAAAQRALRLVLGDELVDQPAAGPRA